MKKIIAIITSLLILVTLIVIFIITDVFKVNEKNAQASMDAYLLAMQGDNSELRDLGIDDDVSKLVNDTISNYFFSEAQYKEINKLYNKTEINVLEEKVIDGSNEIEVIYEIKSFPIVDLMLLILEEPQKYLSDETIAILENEGAKQEDIEKASKEFLTVYEKELPKVEGIMETYKVTMVRNSDGALEFIENSSDLENILLTVPGVNINSTYEKE